MQPTKISVKNSFYYQDKRHSIQHLQSLNIPAIGYTGVSNCKALESKHVVANNSVLLKENTIIRID